MSAVATGVLALCGLMLIFSLGKEDKRCRPLGGMLILMALWRLANLLTNGAIAGTFLLWVYRVLLVVFIALIVYLYIREKRAKSNHSDQ